MKNVLIGIIVVAALVIAYLKFFGNDNGRKSSVVNKPIKVVNASEEFSIGDGRLEDHWLNFEGVYKCQVGDISYLMRFFPEGNVALIAGRGTEDELSGMRAQLVQNAEPFGGYLHNSLVELKGDSLFFRTKPYQGIIDYAGTRMNGDVNKLRFERHSLGKGKKQILEYSFEADEVDS